MNIQLLIIDPQFDFCDPTGSLFVPGADKDAVNIANFIETNTYKINGIHVTLDSHHYVDIAHPIYWKNSKGQNPQPFTIITKDDVLNTIWVPAIPSLYKRTLDYVTKLEANNRYPLCIWPPHCLIGSVGQTIVPSVFNACIKWESQFKIVDHVTKGSNIFTEHYSAVKADVEDPTDPSTQINTHLINSLETSDVLVIMGEASSHCVANTVLDIADNFSDQSSVKKMVFLKGCSSPVPGFEHLEQKFLADMTAKGMRVEDFSTFLK